MLAIYYRLYYRRAGWDLARSRVFSQMLANVYGRLSAAGPSAAGPSATIEHSSIYIYSRYVASLRSAKVYFLVFTQFTKVVMNQSCC